MGRPSRGSAAPRILVVQHCAVVSLPSLKVSFGRAYTSISGIMSANLWFQTGSRSLDGYVSIRWHVCTLRPSEKSVELCIRYA